MHVMLSYACYAELCSYAGLYVLCSVMHVVLSYSAELCVLC